MIDDVRGAIEAARQLAEVRELVTSGRAQAIREAAHLSIGEEARIVRVDPSTIWRWEKGQRLPRGDAAIRYLKLLRAIERGTATPDEE